MAVFSGACLCGKVRYAATAEPVIAGHCHCLDCRRSSGTGHCSHMAVARSAVQIEGELSAYESVADSGNVVCRLFCPTCGSPVYSTNRAMPDLVFLRASSLDDPEVFRPQMTVYAARAATWDPVDAGLPAFEAMPPRM